MHKLLLFTLVALAASTTTINLNSSPELDLLYSFPSSDTIELTLQFYTQGYVSIGFGTTMADSQIYIGYKTSDGSFTVQSYHAAGHTVPTADAVQNLQFVSGDRDSSKTVVTFTRKLDTGNSQDYTIATGTPINLIWAYGNDDSLDYHAARGQTQVTFNTATTVQKLILSLREDHRY